MNNKHAEIKRLIGVRIKQLRKAKTISQEGLSERVGISSKYLSSIERGKENPTLDTLIGLSQALGVEIMELFNYFLEKSAYEKRRAVMDLLRSADKEKLELSERILKTILLT